MRQTLVDDFADALVEDGIQNPRIVPTSAAPPAGPPVGGGRLLEALDGLRGSGIYAKVLGDLDEAAGALLDSMGRSGLDFDNRSEAASEKASSLIGWGGSPEATDVLVGFLEEIALDVGDVTAKKVRSLASRVPRRVQRIAEGESTAARLAIDEQILAPVREVLRDRASSLAAITDLSLSVASVRSRLGV